MKLLSLEASGFRISMTDEYRIVVECEPLHPDEMIDVLFGLKQFIKHAEDLLKED